MFGTRGAAPPPPCCFGNHSRFPEKSVVPSPGSKCWLEIVWSVIAFWQTVVLASWVRSCALARSVLAFKREIVFSCGAVLLRGAPHFGYPRRQKTTTTTPVLEKTLVLNEICAQFHDCRRSAMHPSCARLSSSTWRACTPFVATLPH